MPDAPKPPAPRRPKGSLSYRALKSGRIECRTTHGGKAISRTGVNKSEAAGRVRDAIRQMERGAVNPSRETVRQFAARWLVARRDTIAPATYRGYELEVRLYFVPMLGTHQIAELTVAHVTAMLATRTRGGAKPSTVAKTRAILATMLEDAVREGVVSQNVARLTRAPRGASDPAETHTITPDEARRLLAAARAHPFAALWTVALATGMRQGELLGLRWRDVDLTTGAVQVRVQMQRVAGQFTMTPLKTRSSRREFILPAFALTALRARRAEQEAQRADAGVFWDTTFPDLVMTSTFGAPLWAQLVRLDFHALCMSAGVPHVKFHALRAHAASILAYSGVSVRQVMDLLGHSSARMTHLYTRVFEESRAEVARAMDAAMQPPAPASGGRGKKRGLPR